MTGPEGIGAMTAARFVLSQLTQAEEERYERADRHEDRQHHAAGVVGGVRVGHLLRRRRRPPLRLVVRVLDHLVLLLLLLVVTASLRNVRRAHRRQQFRNVCAQRSASTRAKPRATLRWSNPFYRLLRLDNVTK